MEKIIEQLNIFLKALNEYELLNFIFLILAIVSIIISIILFLKSKKEKKPNYIITTHEIFKKSESLKDLTIDYKGNKVNHLGITYVSFWNKGRETINNTDLIEKDKLRIIFPKKTQILGTDIVFRKNEINEFSTQINSKLNSVSFSFDYLDKNQGFKFRVYHTELNNENIKIKGTIKGVKELINCEITTEFYADKIIDNTIAYPRKWIKNDILWKIYIIPLIPLLLVIYLISGLSASFRNIFFRIPSEFIPKKDNIN